MIVLKDVSFQYEGCEEGVHGIDLTVCDGECVVLTGPSGGGKTTLTKACTTVWLRPIIRERKRVTSG